VAIEPAETLAARDPAPAVEAADEVAASTVDRERLAEALAAVAEAAEVAGSISAPSRAAVRASRREPTPAQRRVVGIGAIAVLGLFAAALVVLTPQTTPVAEPPLPTPFVATTTSIDADQMRERLRNEVVARGIDLRDVDMRLLAPNRVGISGTVPGPSGRVPIELQVALSVGPDGQVATSTALKDDPDGVAPPMLEASLGQVASTLTPDVPSGHRLRRIVVMQDAVALEMVVEGQKPAP
jgi:hypothetical protein